MEQNFNEYLQLRNEIDKLSEQLFKQHKNQVQCKKGCDLCCMDYSVFPVEFHYIKSKLPKEELNTSNKNKNENECLFLKNNECTIYEHRPIICRTHGLPLLYVNSETEEWELSACELNFTNFDEFNTDNTFPQDKYNSRLFILNQKFISNKEYSGYNKFDLIPLYKLKQNL